MNEIEHLAECVMVDTIDFSVENVDIGKLPLKFMQVGGPDHRRWAKGRLQTAYGKNSLEARGVKSRQRLMVSGSPAMHFQGHNIVSSGDVRMLVYSALRAVKDMEWGLTFPLKRALEFVEGKGIEVTRVDTPYLLQLPAGLTHRAAIHGIALAAIQAGFDTSLYVGESVYIDPKSQLEALKAYDKQRHYVTRRGGKLPEEVAAPLFELMPRTLRLEAVHRQKALLHRFEGRLPAPADLNQDRLACMLLNLLDKFDFRRDIRRPLNDEELMGIPRQFRPFVFYWQHGRNVKKLAENDNGYVKARAYLRRNHSIDIEAPPPREEIEDRIELGELLRPENFIAVPADIRSDPRLLFSVDLLSERRRLETRVA